MSSSSQGCSIDASSTAASHEHLNAPHVKAARAAFTRWGLVAVRYRNAAARWGLVLAFAAWTAVIVFGNPDTDGIPCLFTSVTGYACAGCGLQHAVHHFAHGRIADALAANLLAPLLIPLVAWAVASTLLPLFARGRFRLRSFNPHPALVLVLSLVVLAYGIFRNL